MVKKQFNGGGGTCLNAPIGHLEGVCPIKSSLCFKIMSGKFCLKSLKDFFVNISTNSKTCITAHSLAMTKNAFTLAEVLITLVIIGVVAAMTLPSLISQKHNKEIETALKKYYSVLQQVSMQMYNDEGQTINRLNYTRAEFLPVFKKYFISVNANLRTSAGMQDDEETGTSIYSVKEYKTFTKKTVHAGHLDDGNINIGDSIMIFLERPVGGEQMFITMDVNGIKKKPNLWGHDLFTFQIMDDGKVLPMGAEGTMYADENTYCSKNSSSGINGIGCTYKALNDKNFWKNL